MFNNGRIWLNLCSGRWLKLFRLSLKTNQSQNFTFISSRFLIKCVVFLALLPSISFLVFKLRFLQCIYLFKLMFLFYLYVHIQELNFWITCIFLYRDSWFEIIYIKYTLYIYKHIKHFYIIFIFYIFIFYIF